MEAAVASVVSVLVGSPHDSVKRDISILASRDPAAPLAAETCHAAGSVKLMVRRGMECACD